MKNQIKIAAILLLLLIGSMILGTGCKSNMKMKEQKTEDEEREEDNQTIIDGKDNVEVQGSIEGTTYVSSAGNITITLPDAGWSCESDASDYITFSSPDGMMNIVRMDGSEAIATSMFHSAEEYLAYLKGTTPNLEGEVTSFEVTQTDGKNSFSGVFHYTGENEFRYTVSYGIEFPDHCYLINAMLRTEDEMILEEVQTSICECQITE